MCHLTPNSSEKTGFVSSKPSDTAPNTDAVRDEVDKLLCPDCKIFYDGYNCSKCGFLNEESDEGGKCPPEELNEIPDGTIELYGEINGRNIHGIVGAEEKLSTIFCYGKYGNLAAISNIKYNFSLLDVTYGGTSGDITDLNYELDQSLIDYELDQSLIDKDHITKIIKDYHTGLYFRDNPKKL